MTKESTKHPINQPRHKYAIGFKADNGCYCSKRCGSWVTYHQTIDMEGREWTTLGEGYYERKEDALAQLAGKPMEWTEYSPHKAQSILSLD